MEIEYRIIKNHPNFILSNEGRIWDKKKNKETEYFINILGRKAVILDDKEYSLDLLMLKTFKPNEKGYLIRYRDNNYNNISIDNLFWYQPTLEEENKIAKEFGLPTSFRKLMVVDTDGTIREIYEKASELANNYDIKSQTIYNYPNKYFPQINAFIIRIEDEDRINEIIEEWKRNNINKKTSSLSPEEKERRRNNCLLRLEEIRKEKELKGIKEEEKKQKQLIRLKEKEEKKQKQLIRLKEKEEAKKRIYLVDREGNIKEEISNVAQLATKLNAHPNCLYNSISKLRYSKHTESYIISARKWNEETKQVIIDKNKPKSKPLKIKEKNINKQEIEEKRALREQKRLEKQKEIEKKRLIREQKRLEKQKEKQRKKESHNIYIINSDGTIRMKYDSLSVLNNEYGKSCLFNAYMKSIIRSPLLDGYVVKVTDWNDNKDKIIKRINEKEMKRNRKK